MSRGREHKTGLIITGDASGGIRAIRATDSELGKLNQGFDRGSRRSRQFNQDVNATSQGLAVLRRAAAPIAGAIAGMFAANSLQNQINWGDQLQKTNLRIGASTEALSQYNYVASLSGVEFNQLTTAWQRQTRRIAEAAAGTGVAVAALDRLNLSAQELNQLAPEDQFERIAEAMQGVENSSERVRLAQQLWDSEGVKLVQIVNSGTDAIAAMRAEADALGLTISQDTANAMASYNDEVDRLKFAAQGVSQTLLSELVPAITAGLQNVNAFIQEVGGAEVVVGHLTDGAQVLAALLAGRYAGAFATATAAKLAATQQSIAYQMALARMAGVSTTVVASQTALAASVRGVSGALTLVGGPAGAAVIAVGSLFYFREELGFVDAAAKNATIALDDNSAAIRDGSAAALDATYDNLINSLEAVSLQAQEAMAQLTELEARQAFYENSHQGMADSVSGAVDQQTEALADLWARQVELQTAIRKNREAREQATSADRAGAQALEDIVVTADAASASTNTAAAASRDAAKQTTTLANSYENLLDRIQPNRRAARQYAQDVGTLNLALATGRMTTVQYMQAMGMLQESFQAAQRETENTANASEDASQRIANSFLSWETVADNTLRRIDDSGQSLWLGLIDGSESALDTVKRGFQQTLAEIAHMLTTQKLTFQVAGMMGLDTTGMPGGGMGGFSLSPGGISNAWNAVQSGFGSIQWTGVPSATAYGPSYGFAHSATTGTGATGFMGGSTANFSGATGLASLGAGFAGSYAGTELGSSIFGREANSNYGSMAGGAIGTYLGGPMGAFLGSTLGGALDSLFGSGKKEYDYDFQQGGNFGVYGDRVSAFGQFGTTAFSDWNEEARQQLDAMMNGMVELDNTIAEAALPERFDAIKASIDGFAHTDPSTLVDTRLRTMVEGSGSAFADAIIQIADPQVLADSFVKVLQLERLGEQVGGAVMGDIIDEVNRHDAAGDISTAVNAMAAAANAALVMRDASERLNLQFDITADGAIHVASALQSQVGGLENLTAIQQAYYQTAFSESERLAHQQEDLNAQFAALNVEMPESVEQIRQMIEAQDMNTKAGAQLAYELMALTPALDQVSTAVARQNQAIWDNITNSLEGGYQSSLGRDASADDLYYWMTQIESGAVTLDGALAQISNSVEYHATLWQGFESGIADAYEQSLGRIARTDELQYWLKSIESGAVTFEDAIEQIGNSMEAAKFEEAGGVAGLRERAKIERQILQLTGDTAAIRALDLEATHESNRALLQHYWVLQDQQEALNKARENQERYNQALESAQSAFASFSVGIDDWLAQLRGTEQGLGSPADQLAATSEAFEEQYAKALAGDRDALGSITQYADRFIDAQKGWSASGMLTTSTIDRVSGMLESLPDLLSPEEFLAEEFRNALGDQSDTLSAAFDASTAAAVSALIPKFDDIDINTDGLLTFSELSAALAGKATDAEIRALISRVDANGDGMISEQELANYRLGRVASDIGSELEPMFDAIDLNTDGLIDYAEFGRYFSGLATDAELKNIFRTLDADGDGQISRLEAIKGSSQNTDNQTDSLARFFDRAGDLSRGLQVSLSYHQDAKGVQSIGWHVANEIAKMAANGQYLNRFANGGVFSGGVQAFANGGVFTNAIVSSPTLFNMGLMGEEDPEAIVPLSRGAGGRLGIDASGLMRIPEGPLTLPMPDLPLPQFPALGQSDVLQVLQDMRREIAELRKQNAALLGESNSHLAAANTQRGAAATQQIAATKEGNRMLKKLQDDARLEAAKR